MVCLPTEPDALQHYNATHQIRVKRQVTIVLVSQAGGGASAFPGLLPQMRDGVEQQRDRLMWRGGLLIGEFFVSHVLQCAVYRCCS